jgi:hypothetical protein
MRRKLATQSDFVNVGGRLLEALNANATELPHFEIFRDQLASMLEEMREQMAQQDALTASKQTVSKRIKAIYYDGIKLVHCLQRMVQQQYGTRNEKLVEFGVKPFRGRPRRLEDTVTPPVPTPPPPAIE